MAEKISEAWTCTERLKVAGAWFDKQQAAMQSDKLSASEVWHVIQTSANNGQFVLTMSADFLNLNRRTVFGGLEDFFE